MVELSFVFSHDLNLSSLIFISLKFSLTIFFSLIGSSLFHQYLFKLEKSNSGNSFFRILGCLQTSQE